MNHHRTEQERQEHKQLAPNLREFSLISPGIYGGYATDNSSEDKIKILHTYSISHPCLYMHG
jgi:hypothetical protein